MLTPACLPWRMFGRLVRPYAFAVSLASTIITYAIFAGVVIGQLLDGLPGHIIGVIGAASVAFLWVGWWTSSDRFMRWGLFWTTGVWASIAATLGIDVGWWNVNTGLAACWALASGGAWLLEATDARGMQ